MSVPTPFRVAMIASTLARGGAEKQFVYIAESLVRAGADVRVFYYGPGQHYEGILRQNGVPLSNLHVPNRPFVILGRLIRQIRAFQPDLVLIGQFGDLAHGGIAGRLSSGMVLAGIRSDGFYEMGNSRSRFLVRLPHGFIANSHRAKANLIRTGMEPDGIRVLPNVIDLDAFDDQARRECPISLPSGRVLVGAIGSLQPSKRFDRFLQALALARKRAENLYGVIVGADRGCRSQLRTVASDLGLTAEQLVFTGEVSEIPALLVRLQCLAMTSDYEGFPNVILEAMAARLPVISTAAGDAAILVEHGITGYVLPQENVQGLADRMVELAESPRLRSAMGQAGRARVEQLYSIDRLLPQLIPIVRRFAGQQGRARLMRKLDSLWAVHDEHVLSELRS